MKHGLKKAGSILLTLLLLVQLLPMSVLAASSFAGWNSGHELFEGAEGEQRIFVSETAYNLAPGVTEYVTYTNTTTGDNQNIDYFCEIDLSQAEIMVGYAGMENILEDNEITWQMQTVSSQVNNAQSYFERSDEYSDATIVAALNADYYNMATGQPRGLLIIDGVQYNDADGSYYFAIDKDGKAVITNSADTSNIAYATAGGTLLVKDGQVNASQGGRNVTYTAIGIKADGTVVSMVCRGQSYPISCGYTQYEVAEMMKARGCETALLLDGSGSSTFVSRREGETGITTRNSPSDGQERQVSSSIFIISRVQADGVFDHAVISPTNEVYTPGSAIDFDAVGADSSGAPAPLPEGVSWSVDSTYGRINNSTGVFTSNGTTGDVTVYLNGSTGVIGSTTITIANPDKIQFAEDTASIGLGQTSDLGLQVFYNNREINYKDGDLNWDIAPTQYTRKQFSETTSSWEGTFNRYDSIVETESDRMSLLTVGTVSDNQLTCDPVYTGTNLKYPDRVLDSAEKTASAITATVTVSSTVDESIAGTVTLNACMEPYVAMDFENSDVSIFHGLTSGGANDYYGYFDESGTYHPYDASTPGAEAGTGGNYYVESESISGEYDMACLSYIGRQTGNPQIGTATIVSREDGYPVRFGEQSLKIDYDIPGYPSQNDGICFGFTEEIDLSELGNPTRVGIWVYIPEGTPNLWLRLRYRDGSGNTSQVDFTEANIWSPRTTARNADNNWHYFEADISHLQTPVSIPAGMAIRVMYLTDSGSNPWASPQGWVRCQTDENGNIILVDRDDERIKDIAGSVPEGDYTLPTGDVVTIGHQLPIPEVLTEMSGTLYFDNLTYLYGSTTEDTSNPIIDSAMVSAGDGGQTNLRSGMVLNSGALDIEAYFSDSTEIDRNNTGVGSASIYIDNNRLDTAVVDLASGIIRGGISLANGNHTIRISVVDNYGNETVSEYTVTISDEAAPAAAIRMTTDNGSAILGGSVVINFVPRDTSVNSVDINVSLPAEFAEDFIVTPSTGCSFADGGEPSYNSITETLSFSISGSVSGTEPVATLTIRIPSNAQVSSNVTFTATGTASFSDGDTTTFNDSITLPVTAPYTVTAGQMVAGLDSSCYFKITNTADGTPVAGVQLYRDNISIGTSDENGIVNYTDAIAGDYFSVTARDNSGNVSAVYNILVYAPQGNDNGTPTHVWRNAADSASGLNVSWFANPISAGDTAILQISKNEDMSDASDYTGEIKLITFSDGNAAYVCGAMANDLAQNTTYYYRVGDGENWSDVKSFTTTYENTGIDALILGDLQEGNNENLRGVLSQVNVDDMDVVIQTGDLVDNGGSYTLWDSALNMLESINTGRLFAVGNHEQYYSSTNSDMYNQENEEYYSAMYGNVFVATITHANFTSDVLDQMVADANASGATWKILVTHQPAYYTNADAPLASSTQSAIAQALQDGGFDVMLSGHDHAYARTAPMTDGQVDEENGITYFICGSLGEKSYTVTNNPEFNFIKATNDYSALYMTMSTTADTLTINVYDYNGGNPELIDTFIKNKSSAGHEHEYVWDGEDTVSCSCGYTVPLSSYTGYANYSTDDNSGQVYFNAGNLQKGTFAVGDEILHSDEENGFIHDSETVISAQCWEDGYLGCWCHDCNTFYRFSEYRRLGHEYDENHVCTREVFDIKTFTYHVCGHQGKDIADMDIELAYNYGFYTGEPLRPAVTVKDPETGDELFPQSTYGDYMPYWENNVNVGTATIRLVGYDDGPYYGETSVTFQIVPNNVSEEDFTVSTTANSVELRWEPSLGATHYIVYQMIDGQWTRLGIVDETEYTAAGLAPGEYQFMIRPFATVDGENYYSTKNSDVVTATVEGGVAFEHPSVTVPYGSESFTNLLDLEDAAGFAYSSSDESVATVNVDTGEVTIVGAGEAIISATNGEITGQYRLTVNPITVELTWSGADTRTYDGNPSAVTATASGLLDGDSANITVDGGDEKDAGTYTATATAIDNRNYALPEECTVQYTIEPLEITELTWSNTTLTYTGRPIAPSVTSGQIVAGDTVEFSVPAATAVGRYEVTAVSHNPNYVVSADAPSCTFTISMPNVSLESNDNNDQLTWYMDESRIMIVGIASGDVQVDITAIFNGSEQSTSTTVHASIQDNPQGEVSITLGGITYIINADGLIAPVPNVNVSTGATQVEVPELDIGEDDKAQLEDAANDINNQFAPEKIVAAVSNAVQSIVDAALEGQDDVSVDINLTLEISQSLTVVEYKPGVSYKVDIKPVFKVTREDTGDEISSGELSNDQITAPVEVTIRVPDSINLSSSTFVRHLRSDGRTEYLRPTISGQLLTFTTTSFSEFEILSDNREVTVSFPMDEGTQTVVYTPAEIGQSLPQLTAPEGQTFDGWKINGTVYDAVDEDFLNELNGQANLVAEAVFTDIPTGPVGPVGPIGPVDPGDEDDDCPSEQFTDVDTDKWYHEAIDFVLREGLMNGTGSDTFSPDDPTTRGMLVTILYRLEGEPAVTGRMPFEDVKDGWYYTDAIIWAARNGIVNGVTDTEFAPDDYVTREQMAAILYRYAVLKGWQEGPGGRGLDDFADYEDISPYAEDAMTWAIGAGVIDGMENDTLQPKEDSTRAQIATVLMRFSENVAK